AAGWEGLVELPTQESAGAWLRTEADNWLASLHAAMDLGRFEQVTSTALAIRWFAEITPGWGHWHEVYTLSSEAAERQGDLRAQATHLNLLAWAQNDCLRDNEASVRTAYRAAEIADAVGDPLQQGLALQKIAIARVRREPQEGYDVADRAATLLEESSAWDDLSQAQVVKAWARLFQGRYAECLDEWDKALSMLDDPARPVDSSIVLYSKANDLSSTLCLLALGRRDEALAAARRTHAYAQELDIPRFIGRSLQALGGALAVNGDREQALAAMEQAVVIFDGIGEEAFADHTRRFLADYEDARQDADAVTKLALRLLAY
ncbi:hypothetical protein KDL01_33450, partial [Actinospica durhamensis]